MALAEARAAWQRTANRCFVQEDAKRAPKLACCSAASPSFKQADTGHTSAAGGLDIPNTGPLPFNLNPSYSNLSPNSKWWLQLQPNYGHQKGWMDEQFNSLEGDMEPCQTHESSAVLASNEDDPGLNDETTSNKPSNSQYRNITTSDNKDFEVKEENLGVFSTRNCQEPCKLEVKEDVGEIKGEGLVGCEVSKNANELYFDSETSWIGAERNSPWWRTADSDELALLVAQRSLDHIENCDLPSPQISHVKKDVNVNICSFGHDGISGSLLDPKFGAGSHRHSSTQLHAPGSLTAGGAHHKFGLPAEGELVPSADKPLIRDIPTHERMPEMDMFENDASRVRLMEALCHSQTRAREAERAAKQACAEKEHVVKLVFRQASQLFAYKQLVQLLQLENMYYQLTNNKSQPISFVFPAVLPWKPQRTSKMRNNWAKSSNKKRAKRSCPWYDVSKYTVAFALGLGLVGAGFLLGWTAGWMLPTW